MARMNVYILWYIWYMEPTPIVKKPNLVKSILLENLYIIPFSYNKGKSNLNQSGYQHSKWGSKSYAQEGERERKKKRERERERAQSVTRVGEIFFGWRGDC